MMREWTKSIISYSWEAPLLALQQIVGQLDNSKKAENDPNSEGQLDGMFQAAFLAGDDLQRDMVDMGFDLLRPQTWTPSGLARTTADFSSRIADGARYLDPSQNGVAAWLELRNKVNIYMLVIAVESKLQIPSGMFSLQEYVDKAYGLGPFPALWAVEGLGHDYADRFQPYTEKTRGILTEAKVKDLPPKSLTMLHAGIGLGFAASLLKNVKESSPDDDVRRVLELFVQLCRANSQPGYEGAALESLGLVTRTWHRKLVSAVDRLLMQMDPSIAAYFWRGAGRALYFLPVNFLPTYGSITNAIRMSRQSAPHELARENMLAGIAWAVTVVNMLVPGVMQSFLRQHGEEMRGQRAFTNGVASSIIMRFDTTPDEGFIREFILSAPMGETGMRDLWKELVQDPADEALDRIYPVLRDKKRLGEIFRFQSLSDLAENLSR